MTSTPPTLLNLPVPLLSAILGFLPLDEGIEGFSAAISVRRVLSQAGQLRLSELPLHLSSTKLQKARDAGDEANLLAFIRRASYVWRSAVVAADSQEDLEVLLGSLQHGSNLALSELTLKFDSYIYVGLPQVLTNFTGLRVLAIEPPHIYDEVLGTQRLPSGDLPRLSALTALRCLKVDAAFTAFPPQALSQLPQLSRLELSQRDSSIDTIELGAAQFSAFTALRHLQLAGVVPTLSRQEARELWKHLQHLSIEPVGSCQDADFWLAVPSLKSLTSLGLADFPSGRGDLVSNCLLACTTLEQLSVGKYSGAAVPQLPPLLPRLLIEHSPQLSFLPTSQALQSLALVNCTSLQTVPAAASAMVQLTHLKLVFCNITQLAAPLTALPGLEELDLSDNPLPGLPQGLACLPRLRKLELRKCDLRQVPAVLGGGGPSRLEYLGLSKNRELVMDNAGLDVLRSLTALQCLSLHRIMAIHTEVEGGWEAVQQSLPEGCLLYW